MAKNDTVAKLESEIQAALARAESVAVLDELRVRYLGKKGEFTTLMKELGDLSPDERREFGKLINETKTRVEAEFDQRKNTLERSALSSTLEKEWIDVTLPVNSAPLLHGAGSLHPLTRVQRELEDTFRGLGFSVVDGPELEREFYNFEALNVPANHPARDMQDTFWSKGGDVLRTHTSSMQVRALELMKPPLRIVAPGRCFRYERSDSSHEHTFYQMEGMMVDKNVTVGHLIYFMKTLLREIFGGEQKIRLRPGYFPFVEPGFELDIWFRGRWLEFIGCGLVHPKVFEYSGVDPNEWQGFAFGCGLSRLVMMRYDIDDIRHMLGGDLRFLKQFS